MGEAKEALDEHDHAAMAVCEFCYGKCDCYERNRHPCSAALEAADAVVDLLRKRLEE